ncbi:MAG: hypothetical protein RL607_35 [Bacteroidota bacterium]|jgi:beta-glucanase (GH16 family)
MKKIVFTLILFSQISWSQQKERKLVWEENFEGTELNTAVWNFELGNGCPNVCGWGNNERELYTQTNHQVSNGYLTIEARKDGNQYTSTRITTAGKKEFMYGRIEARAQLPVGQGIWPAFWMLGANIGQVGWPLCGEIDILEYVGKNPHQVYTTLHTTATHGDHASSKVTTIPKIEEGFHTYAIEWDAQKIEFFVDNLSVYVYAPADRSKEVWPFNQKFFILVNMAIGGNFGGPEVNDTIFPQRYVIDYIRVYQ